MITKNDRYVMVRIKRSLKLRVKAAASTESLSRDKDIGLEEWIAEAIQEKLERSK